MKKFAIICILALMTIMSATAQEILKVSVGGSGGLLPGTVVKVTGDNAVDACNEGDTPVGIIIGYEDEGADRLYLITPSGIATNVLCATNISAGDQLVPADGGAIQRLADDPDGFVVGVALENATSGTRTKIMANIFTGGGSGAGGEDNQTITTGEGLTGADGGTDGDFTIDIDLMANSGLKIESAKLGADFGTGTNQVARGNHDHDGIYEPAFTRGNLTATGSIQVDNVRQVIGGAAQISHLTSAGHQHIPSGGATNQLLIYGGSSGTASWSAMNDAIHGNRGGGDLHLVATTSVNGFMSSADKTKLNGIATGADNYANWLIAASGTAGTGTVSSGNTVTITAGTGISATRSTRDVTIENTAPWTSSSNDYIQNQNSSNQSANFRISGVGRANTSFQSPLYTRPDAGTVAIRPYSNSTTAIQLQNSAGTNILNVDATNQRVGIGTSTVNAKLHVVQSATTQPGIYSEITPTTSTYASIQAVNPNASGGAGIISTGFYGVYGESPAATGFGGRFHNSHASGTGLLAAGNDLGGSYLSGGSGVAGTSSNVGVYGRGTDASGSVGVYGRTVASDGVGVIGEFDEDIYGALGTQYNGVLGVSDNPDGAGVLGNGLTTTNGVYGRTELAVVPELGSGVFGYGASDNSIGVIGIGGEGENSSGIAGWGADITSITVVRGVGVIGQADPNIYGYLGGSNTAVFGKNESAETSLAQFGVIGQSIGAGSTTEHFGVYGYATGGSSNFGVYSDAAVGVGEYTINLGGSGGIWNNCDIGDAGYVRIYGAGAATTITGFTGGYNGRILYLFWDATYNLSIAHQNTGSTTTNRIITNTGGTVTSSGVGMATFIYSETLSRWILISWLS
ncbi:MAG TPA: hypothetical protein ENN07_04820 [candidate division Zixibacteria bacterium]|nr:hypothetical protein [candidate division Zixibacteria bacterium]